MKIWELQFINTGSIVSVLDREEARDFARKARAAMRKDLLDLAEQENIPEWQNAIALWTEQHRGEKVSLLQLQQALEMPLMEVWRLAAAFPYALSVGWSGGVIIGKRGVVGLVIARDTFRSSCKNTVRST